ncbi:hypothetical protein OOK60_15205 [Trichothermofontia sichuanensis B231]|uniref:hypothetical protein n=1 Tax=Trichothermofontia sichuanensis TaxID=3045816 RepID=UPI0022471962|nr:hypothetical protein [Trichothermofontia sichuanensis]UZQ53825.1 hypothetical protein OOK60_15205 [Trichothermofontia sichuanensis B231]
MMRLTSTLRLLATGSVSLACATVLNWVNYRGYWHGTVLRAETVNFNILAHTLPNRLSEALIRQDFADIDRVINSHYGLFSIVVTDCQTANKSCPNQKILAQSHPYYPWQKALTSADLTTALFSTLRDPIPRYPEWQFVQPHAIEPTASGLENEGRIIGRVYFVRNQPPTFWQDQISWLRGDWHTLGFTSRGYTLSLLVFSVTGLAMWVYTERSLERKRHQRDQVLAEYQSLLKEATRLRSRLREQLRLNQTLKSQYEAQLKAAKEEGQSLHDQIHQLQQEGELQEQELRSLQQNLESLQTELLESQRDQQAIQSEIEQLQQTIADKEAELKSINDTRIEISLEAEQAKQKAQDLERHLAQLAEEKKAAEELSLSLQEQLESQPRSLVPAPELERLKADLEKAKTEEEQAFELIEQIEREKGQIEREKVDVQNQLYQLEYEYGLILQKNEELEERLVQYEAEQSFRNIDLSDIRVAIVGGHQTMMSYVQSTLSQENHLRDFRPLSKDTHLSTKAFKEKLKKVDLILVVRGYMSHSMSQIVDDLETKGQLRGKVIRLPTTCTSGPAIVRIIREEIHHTPK